MFWPVEDMRARAILSHGSVLLVRCYPFYKELRHDDGAQAPPGRAGRRGSTHRSASPGNKGHSTTCRGPVSPFRTSVRNTICSGG